MAITLERVRRRADIVMVPMNEVRSRSWSPNLQFIATEGLNGCTAIAILSDKAGILAHVAPRTPTANGEQNIRDLMQLVIQHYNTRKREGLFPDSTTSIILAAVHEGEVALPDQINVTRAVLTRLRLPITSRQYRVREQGENRTAGETSMIIHGRSASDPHIYVNDELMAQDAEPHETEQQTESQNNEQDIRRGESEQHVQNAASAFDRLKRQGYSDEQATQQMVASLNRTGRSPSAAANEVHTLLAISRLRAQGISFADAISQLVSRLVALGNSVEAARARVNEAFSSNR